MGCISWLDNKVIRLSVALIAAFLLCIFSYTRVQAEEDRIPDMMEMITDVGSVQLRDTPCTFNELLNLPFAVIATENDNIYIGCWGTNLSDKYIYLAFPEDAYGDMIALPKYLFEPVFLDAV